MNELSKKGGQPSRPVHYACLWHNSFYQGAVTQRNPLRDNLNHVESEFYGSQVCLISGENCEISSRLTIIRRPGSVPYNTQTFPPINRYYENRTTVYNGSQTFAQEFIQVVCDTASVIYDCTGPSTKNTIFTKTTGAGSTYFQSVGNSLYFSDGPDRKKLITPSLVWAANQNFNVGDQILDSNGNLEVVLGSTAATIADIEVGEIPPIGGHPAYYYLKITFTTDVSWTAGTPITFSGVTTYTSLNGQTLPVVTSILLTPTPNVAYFTSPIPTTYGPATDTGTATPINATGSGLSGGTVPVWNGSLAGTKSDNQLTWQNFGPPVYDWQTAAPTSIPILTPVTGNRQWTPNTPLSQWYSILDLNNTIQVVINWSGTGPVTGANVPNWSTVSPTFTQFGGQTTDGTIVWQDCGPVIPWGPSTAFQTFQCVLDSNQNLQLVTNGGGGGSATGSTPPTSWNTTIGGTTPDGTITWTCVGPGVTIVTGTVQYGYSWVSVDGSITTSSPMAPQSYGSQVLGPAGNGRVQLTGAFPTDPQIAFAWVWRTVQGGSVLFFDQGIPNPTPGTASTWYALDVIPDTSLNELIEAPIDNTSDPPPVGLTALCYHLGCVWGALGNQLRYSDGPLVTSGNGNTAWSPSNIFIFPSSVLRAWPTASGLFVLTSSDIYIIQGTNTPSSPLFATPFLQNIGILSYDSFAVNGSVIFLYTSDNQVITLDPSSGVSEVGFPIGDQFGPDYGTGTFTPTSTQLTWHIAQSQDKGLYVSDFAGSWWRMCPTPSPESGITWSPRAAITNGFSAVQSVETSPGIHSLLIGPASSGPILKRNYQSYSDNGSSYPAWAVLGSLVLAQPGQLAMVESFTTDSVAVGTPISLAVQLDEISSYLGLSSAVPNAPGTGYAIGDLVSISGGEGGIYKVSSITGAGTGPVNGLTVVAPGDNYPLTQIGAVTTAITGAGTGLTVNTTNGGLFETLVDYVQDPTQLEPPITLYAQRFYLSQTQLPAVCRHLQILINWGSDSVRNEILSLSLFGGFEQEK